MSNRKTDSAILLLAGIGIGVGIGVLFAPEKGSKTRDKIKIKYDDLKDQALEKYSKSKGDLMETVDELLSKSSYKAEDAITFLEEKLAELKIKNAKLQK